MRQCILSMLRVRSIKIRPLQTAEKVTRRGRQSVHCPWLLTKGVCGDADGSNMSESRHCMKQLRIEIIQIERWDSPRSCICTVRVRSERNSGLPQKQRELEITWCAKPGRVASSYQLLVPLTESRLGQYQKMTTTYAKVGNNIRYKPKACKAALEALVWL